MAKKKATSRLVGRTIVEVRQMTGPELQAEYWVDRVSRYRPAPAVLVLDDGTRLYPSQDGEGNGPGCLFGRDPGVDRRFKVL